MQLSEIANIKKAILLLIALSCSPNPSNDKSSQAFSTRSGGNLEFVFAIDAFISGNENKLKQIKQMAISLKKESAEVMTNRLIGLEEVGGKLVGKEQLILTPGSYQVTSLNLLDINKKKIFKLQQIKMIEVQEGKKKIFSPFFILSNDTDDDLTDPEDDHTDPSKDTDDDILTDNEPDVPAECSVNWETFTSADDLSCFQSVEEVLEAIPEKVRPNWVMMHTSASNQFASINEPRIIIFAPNGKFILAFEMTSSQTLEVAVFDFIKNTWDMAGITFGDAIPKIERELCKSCHTNKPRPNWTAYPNWPGTFGNKDVISQEELDHLTKVSAAPSGRYQYLKFQNKYPLEGVLRPNVNYRENGNNQIMNFFLARNTGRALASAVMKDASMSQKNKLDLAYTLACVENNIAQKMSEFAYEYSDFFGFNKASGDNSAYKGRMWIGFNYIDWPAGILLFNELLKEDPQLKKQFPELAATLSDPNLEALYNTGIDSHPGWSKYDFTFQESFYMNTQSPDLSCGKVADFIK